MTDADATLIPPVTEGDWKHMSWRARAQILDRVNAAIHTINAGADRIRSLVDQRKAAERELAHVQQSVVEARQTMARAYAETDLARAELEQLRADAALAREAAHQHAMMRALRLREGDDTLGRRRLQEAEAELHGHTVRPLRAVS